MITTTIKKKGVELEDENTITFVPYKYIFRVDHLKAKDGEYPKLKIYYKMNFHEITGGDIDWLYKQMITKIG